MTSSPNMRLVPPRHRVCPRARIEWAVQLLLQGLALAVAAAVSRFAGWPGSGAPAWLPPSLLALTLLAVLVVPFWRYRVHRWEATDTAIYAQSGLLWLERRVVPMSRVQTVDLHAGPLAQMLSLASVTVTTASAAGDVDISGLDAATARALVDQLSDIAQLEYDDAT